MFISDLFLRKNCVLRQSFVRLQHEKFDGHKVNKMEKRFLVWTGKYKTVDEVPAFVGQGVMERARNRMRIKIANYMMLATVLGCMAMIYSGKKAAERGESVAQQNIQWHKDLKAEANK